MTSAQPCTLMRSQRENDVPPPNLTLAMPTLDLPLSFLYRPPAPHVAQPWLLVLMHGVGSNEQDLFGLAPHVSAPFHVLSLRAPHRLGPQAHAWFAFAVAADGARSIDEPQETASRARV